MKHVRKSALLGYLPREMQALVADVERYPEFLPWCSSAAVLQRHPDGVTARLGLQYMGVRHAFTTRNTQVAATAPGAADAVTMQLIDGPFKVLDGTWLFQPLRRGGGTVEGCKVELDLRYAFANLALELVISPVFDRIADTFVDSFVRRAEQVHGPR